MGYVTYFALWVGLVFNLTDGNPACFAVELVYRLRETDARPRPQRSRYVHTVLYCRSVSISAAVGRD